MELPGEPSISPILYFSESLSGIWERDGETQKKWSDQTRLKAVLMLCMGGKV
jgi:hypothetical protein